MSSDQINLSSLCVAHESSMELYELGLKLQVQYNGNIIASCRQQHEQRLNAKSSVTRPKGVLVT